MSFCQVELYDEGTPLLSNTEPNSRKRHASHALGSCPETVENISVDQKHQSTPHVNSNNQSLSSNDGNNNSNEEHISVDLQQQEIRVYAKRWYILAVFSLLGVLQVRCNFHRKMSQEMYLKV